MWKGTSSRYVSTGGFRMDMRLGFHLVPKCGLYLCLVLEKRFVECKISQVERNESLVG
jgi:hypothetical protein